MPYVGILGLWPDYGRGPMERSGSKLGFLGYSTIVMKFLIDRVPSCPMLEFWDFGRIMAVGPWSAVAQNRDSWVIPQSS